MKKNSKKRGFTIVELVIVIAVIAILAAVLIPTFASLIKKANLSADQQAVTSMNLSLQADEIADGAPEKLKKEDSDGEDVKTVYDVLKADGFSVEPQLPKPVTDGYAFYWIQAPVNRVVLVEMDGEDPKSIYYPANPINGYECTYDSSTLKVQKGEETVEDVEWFPFAAGSSGQQDPDVQPSPEFQNKNVWVYTEGFSIANKDQEHGSLTITGQPQHAYDSISDALSAAEVISDSLIKLNKDYTESITLNKSITLDLNGHTLTGAGSGPVIKFDQNATEAITLNLFNTKSTEGKITGGNNASYPGTGGGIYVINGTLNMYGGTITGNSALSGGGVGVETTSDNDAAFNMYGGTISNNTATNGGGGLYVAKNVTATKNPQFTMKGGEISGNSLTASSNYGGGLYVNGAINFSIEGGKISTNSANYGGGIAIDGGAEATIGGSVEISNNTSTKAGGGIYVTASKLTLGYVEIKSNTAGEATTKYGQGGGVYSSNSTLIVNDATIKENKVCGTTTTNVTRQSAVASGAGIFWYGRAISDESNPYYLHLAGGSIQSNVIESQATQTNLNIKLGAGVYCVCDGQRGFPNVYLSTNCNIKNNTGAAAGMQFCKDNIDFFTDNQTIKFLSDEAADYYSKGGTADTNWNGEIA